MKKLVKESLNEAGYYRTKEKLQKFVNTLNKMLTDPGIAINTADLSILDVDEGDLGYKLVYIPDKGYQAIGDMLIIENLKSLNESLGSRLYFIYQDLEDTLRNSKGSSLDITDDDIDYFLLELVKFKKKIRERLEGKGLLPHKDITSK